MNTSHDISLSDDGKLQKIQSLRDMITNAEKTIQGAKSVLLQLEGKKRPGRKRKLEEESDGSTVIQGTFDGQIMIGSDGKQYPVPANYASKSKLVEGDFLKLTITEEGSFIYKQIGPVERRHAIGIVTQDEHGNYYVMANGKPYRVLLASVTYFKAEPGDEAVIVVPRDIESSWGSIENIIQKAKFALTESTFSHSAPVAFSAAAASVTASKKSSKTAQQPEEEVEKIAEPKNSEEPDMLATWKENVSVTEDTAKPNETVSLNPISEDQKTEESPSENDEKNTEDLLDEWKADIEEIEREIERSKAAEKTE